MWAPDRYIYIYICWSVAFQVLILKGFLFLVMFGVFGRFWRGGGQQREREREREKKKKKDKTRENTERKNKKKEEKKIKRERRKK